MIIGTLGLDNIAVAFALGPLQLGRRRTLVLGLAFGCAEAGMTLLGAALGDAWLPAVATADMTRAGVLATLAVTVLGLAWVKSRPAGLVSNPLALIALALLLGIDNFVSGSVLDASGPSIAAIMATGILIGALAAMACFACGALFRLAPRWGSVASAFMLSGLGVIGMA